MESNMADHAAQLEATDWGGGTSPYAVGHGKLGMWLFILSDSVTFSALLIGYSYVRVAARSWPTPFRFWPSVVTATAMTLILLSSSLTMVLAVGAAKRGRRGSAIGYLLLTIFFGLSFVVLHLNEWFGLIHEGVRLWANPWGVPLFGATFFTLTGLHMTHVLTGVIYLAFVAIGVSRGTSTAYHVEVSGLYWHFVDLVWMFSFPLVYLLGLTAVEVLLAYIQVFSTAGMLSILMFLSLIKAALIIAYFMHLRFEKAALVLSLLPAVTIVIGLLFVFFPDGFRALELGVAQP